MTFLAPTDATAVATLKRGLTGPVVMLNLLKFRETADYAHAPHLAPPAPIPGRDAYALYEAGIAPLLAASGGAVLFSGTGGEWFIGPAGAGWDRVLLVRQASLEAFFAFAQDPAAVESGHHRTAALTDSRLLPLAPDQAENT